MLEFVKMNIGSIVLLLLVIIGLLFLYKKGKKDLVYKIILALAVQAEKALGSGTGELKYVMVIEKLYAVLPAVLRILFTQKELDELIEKAVIFMKDYLSKGNKDLLGYEDEFLRNFNFDPPEDALV